MTIRGNENRPHIRTKIPGAESRKIIRADHRHMITTTKSAPVTAVKGRGTVVEDADGNRLLDFAAGIGVLNVGHCHPKVVRAVQDQAGRLMHFAGTDFYYTQQAELARRLGNLAPIAGHSKTFYTQSGTEANEAAIKLAKQGTGRPRFMAFLGAFHGRTQGSLALTASKARQQTGFSPAMPGVTHVPFPAPYRNIWRVNGYEEPDELSNLAIEHIEEVFQKQVPPKDVAAFFWEPVQGEGGYHTTPKPFAKALRQLCDEHGILLVADEVQTGFGRTGKMFACEHFGIKADIVTVAKAMGSGLPIGAAIARADLDFDSKGRHSNTYGGNLVTCASALATIDVIESEDLVQASLMRGEQMGKHLSDFKERFASIGDARGLGLMRAIEFVGKDGKPDARTRDKVEEEAWKRGLILLGCGASAIRFIPPLNVSKGQIDGAMEVLEEALKAAKA